MAIFIPLMCLLGMGGAVPGLRPGVPADPARAMTCPCGCCGGRSACCPRSGKSGARRCSASWTTSTAGPAVALRRGLRERRAAAAALGRAAAAVWAMVAVAAGSAGLYAFVGVRYGLLAWAGCSRRSPLVLLVSYALAASVLLRQPPCRPSRPAGRPARRPGMAGTGVYLLRRHHLDEPAVGGAGAGDRGAAAGGRGRRAVGRQRRGRPPHRPAGRVQRRPVRVPVRDPRSRGDGCRRAARRPGLYWHLLTSATGSATTRSSTCGASRCGPRRSGGPPPQLHRAHPPRPATAGFRCRSQRLPKWVGEVMIRRPRRN